jgi:hypothetical protein
MSEQNIAIKPKSWELTATNLRVYITNYKLSESANITVLLLDNEDKILKKEMLVIDGDYFSNWGTDDSYIILWVCNKLGLELA